MALLGWVEKSLGRDPHGRATFCGSKARSLESPSRSKPDQGVVTVRGTTLNQHGEVVYTLMAKLLVPRSKG
jgi:acyl dehydratase